MSYLQEIRHPSFADLTLLHAGLLAGLALALLVAPAAAVVADDAPAPTERDLQAPLLNGLGDHHHAISTEDPMVQRLFDQGLVLHFGFNHVEAVRSFREAARLDPECAICFAGVALSLGPNINSVMDPGSVEPAFEAIERARELAPQASERERAYIRAIAERYAADPPADRSALDRAYADAMGRVARTYPEDSDAAALHAEALMVLHPWDYWRPEGGPKPWTPEILEVLDRVLDRRPEHPFANHLFIHAVEASEHPERALPSARRLEEVVPGAGHLVHMPAHIYIRIGEYHEASVSNRRAIEADEAYLEQVAVQGLYPLAYYPHNYHFLWATATLEGRSETAIRAARGVAERADREKMREPGFRTLQHYFSIPYYALAAFGRWQQILDEPAPEEELLYPRAVWRYARGMAHAALGELEKARADLAFVRRAADDPRLDEVTIWDINRTSRLMEIAGEILDADLARAEDRTETALDHLRRAVELEDTLNYDEPPPWGPATRRYLGDALLEAGRLDEAERVYRQDLEAFPENGWSLYGLLECLRRKGESEAAREVGERFERAWRHADVPLTASRF